MPHPSHTPKTLLLLGAMAALLALVVGLVGSARRASPRERPAPAAGPTVSVARTLDGLHTPEILPPAEAEAAPAPARPLAATPTERTERPRLVGLVLRADGEPAGRAQVVLGDLRTECAADGRFDLLLAGDYQGADLLAWEPGQEPVVRVAFGAGLPASGETFARLVLGPTTLTLEGAVLHEDGTPAGGWTVELDGPDPLASYGLRAPVRSDDGGRFTLTDVPAGSHALRAWKDSPRSAVRSVQAAAGSSGLSILVPLE